MVSILIRLIVKPLDSVLLLQFYKLIILYPPRAHAQSATE